MSVIRPPSQWPTAQHLFHEAYDTDATDLPRWDAWYRLRYVDGDTELHGRLTILEHLFHRHPEEPADGDVGEIALWPLDAQPHERAAIWFEADGPSCAGLAHAGRALIVGEPVVNGALCVEIDDVTVWPIYNPQQPTEWADAWR